MAIQEEMVRHVVKTVLEKHQAELKVLERDVVKLEHILSKPFAHMNYDDAIEYLQKQGHEIQWGDDFGAPDETALATLHDGPVFVERFPTAIKAFYMKPDPDRPEVVLAADLLAPEGYGEIIGGSQRIDDMDLLLRGSRNINFPRKPMSEYWTCAATAAFPFRIRHRPGKVCRLDLRPQPPAGGNPFPGCSTASIHRRNSPNREFFLVIGILIREGKRGQEVFSSR